MVFLLAAISFFQGLALWAQYYMAREARNAAQP